MRGWAASAFPRGLLRRVSYLLLTLPLGVVYFGVLVGGLASAVGGAFIIGIPLFVGLMFLWRSLARFERRKLRRLLDVEIEDPYREPVSATRLGRIRDRATDPATWKDLAYLLLLLPLGLVSFTVVVCLSGTALGLLDARRVGLGDPGRRRPRLPHGRRGGGGPCGRAARVRRVDALPARRARAGRAARRGGARAAHGQP